MVNLTTFNKWLNEAAYGSRFVYHIGFLMADRVDRVTTGGIDIFIPNRLAKMANTVWDAQEENKVFLFQKKIGVGVYQYIAVRRRPIWRIA